MSGDGRAPHSGGGLSGPRAETDKARLQAERGFHEPLAALVAGLNKMAVTAGFTRLDVADRLVPEGPPADPSESTDARFHRWDPDAGRWVLDDDRARRRMTDAMSPRDKFTPPDAGIVDVYIALYAERTGASPKVIQQKKDSLRSLHLAADEHAQRERSRLRGARGGRGRVAQLEQQLREREQQLAEERAEARRLRDAQDHLVAKLASLGEQQAQQLGRRDAETADLRRQLADLARQAEQAQQREAAAERRAFAARAEADRAGANAARVADPKKIDRTFHRLVEDLDTHEPVPVPVDGHVRNDDRPGKPPSRPRTAGHSGPLSGADTLDKPPATPVRSGSPRPRQRRQGRAKLRGRVGVVLIATSAAIILGLLIGDPDRIEAGVLVAVLVIIGFGLSVNAPIAGFRVPLTYVEGRRPDVKDRELVWRLAPGKLVTTRLSHNFDFSAFGRLSNLVGRLRLVTDVVDDTQTTVEWTIATPGPDGRVLAHGELCTIGESSYTVPGRGDDARSTRFFNRDGTRAELTDVPFSPQDTAADIQLTLHLSDTAPAPQAARLHWIKPRVRG